MFSARGPNAGRQAPSRGKRGPGGRLSYARLVTRLDYRDVGNRLPHAASTGSCLRRLVVASCRYKGRDEGTPEYIRPSSIFHLPPDCSMS